MEGFTGKSIVLNCNSNMSNLAEIRFSESMLPWEKLKVKKKKTGQTVIVNEFTPFNSIKEKCFFGRPNLF